MNLLTKTMEDCKMMTRTLVSDKFGGYGYEWSEGATFKAAIAKSSTAEQMLAEQRNIAESYTVVVGQTMTLDYHDVFKRLSDNAIFRVTSRTVDSTSHPASTVKIAKVSAERLEALPSLEVATNATNSGST